MMETVIRFGKSKHQLCVPKDEADGDGLNFLAGKDMDFIATQAMDGTLLPGALLRVNRFCLPSQLRPQLRAHILVTGLVQQG